MLFLIQGIKCKISSGSLERCFLGKVYSAVMSLCCLEIWPRTERKEFLFRMLMSLSCITLTKAALTTAPWMYLLFPGYSLCILSHKCFILLRKKKRHSGENILDVSGICVMTQSILHAYIIVGEKSLTSLRYTIGSFLMLWETRPTGFLSDQYCHCVW